MIIPVILFTFFCFTGSSYNLSLAVVRGGKLNVQRAREWALVFDTTFYKRSTVIKAMRQTGRESEMGR